MPVFLLVSAWRHRLRLAVERSGKKHSAIAREAGINPGTLSRILTGARKQPSFDTVVKIARAANENVAWLLDERGFALSTNEQRQLRDAVRVLDASLQVASKARRDPRPEANAIRAGANREIPRAFAALGARLVYEAAGDSMVGAGIADRDLLYVKPVATLREANGRIAVCRVGDVEYVKQLEVRAGRIRLLSRADGHAPIELRERDEELQVIGIVVAKAGTVGG